MVLSETAHCRRTTAPSHAIWPIYRSFEEKVGNEPLLILLIAVDILASVKNSLK